MFAVIWTFVFRCSPGVLIYLVDWFMSIVLLFVFFYNFLWSTLWHTFLKSAIKYILLAFLFTDPSLLQVSDVERQKFLWLFSWWTCKISMKYKVIFIQTKKLKVTSILDIRLSMFDFLSTAFIDSHYLKLNHTHQQTNTKHTAVHSTSRTRRWGMLKVG